MMRRYCAMTGELLVVVVGVADIAGECNGNGSPTVSLASPSAVSEPAAAPVAQGRSLFAAGLGSSLPGASKWPGKGVGGPFPGERGNRNPYGEGALAGDGVDEEWPRLPRARGLEAAPAGPISPPGKTGEPRVRGVG